MDVTELCAELNALVLIAAICPCDDPGQVELRELYADTQLELWLRLCEEEGS